MHDNTDSHDPVPDTIRDERADDDRPTIPMLMFDGMSDDDIGTAFDEAWSSLESGNMRQIGIEKEPPS